MIIWVLVADAKEKNENAQNHIKEQDRQLKYARENAYKTYQELRNIYKAHPELRKKLKETEEEAQYYERIGYVSSDIRELIREGYSPTTVLDIAIKFVNANRNLTNTQFEKAVQEGILKEFISKNFSAYLAQHKKQGHIWIAQSAGGVNE